MFRTTEAMVNSDIVKAGYLTKSPPGAAPPMSQWRRRWFVLCDSLRVYPLAERHLRLEYYQNEGDVRKLCDPKGVIDLKNCTRVSGVARIKGHNYVFDICTKERTYHIAAETPTEKYDWMRTLNELLFTPLAILNGGIEIQDLEKAEMIRKKSISKASAERQSSLGELTERQRPVSCYINPDMKSVDEHQPLTSQQQQRRPLPPTPDAPNSLTMQLESRKMQPSSHQPTMSSPSLLFSSPPPVPPVPKPRSKNSVESNKNISSITLPPSLPACDITIQDLSSDYENMTVVPDYEDIEQPPVPKPRSKISMEGILPSSTFSNQSHDNQTMSNSGYGMIVPNTITAPDYEDIDVSKSAMPYEETIFIGPSHKGDRILFLNEDDYADPNAESYEHQLESPEASNYEVPVNIMPSQIPPQRNMYPQVASILPNDKNAPPLPPPRNRQKHIVRRDSSIHSSLINLADEELYSELQDARTGPGNENDEHYGRLIRFGQVRERRYSNPEIVPISPRSHSSSPLFFNMTKPKQSPPPVPTPYSSFHFNTSKGQQQKHYYENTGYSSVVDKSNSDYSVLSSNR